jgi:glycosyltransferase involved in cell wall biosynthesis
MKTSVSVVMPSYNQAKYLKDALGSIAAQRDLVHEFFVYDGGSSDNSAAIIRSFESQLDHWISRPDAGQSAVIADGFNRATGDVLYWLNSDDVLLPGALRRVIELFDSHPEIDVVRGYSVAIGPDGRILRVVRDPESVSFWARWGLIRIIQPTMFVRRQAYEAVGGLDRDLCCAMDTDLILRLVRCGARWGSVRDYLAAFRLHPEAKNVTQRDTYRVERQMLRLRYPEFIRIPLRRNVVRPMLYTANLISGRSSRRWREERRLRGRHFGEAFGATCTGPDSISESGQAHD